MSVKEKAVEPPKVEMAPSIRADFEDAATGVSTRAGLAIDDVRSAYEDKPESLTSIYNSMKHEKSEMGGWIGWSVFWLIVIPPIMLYTGYKAWESYDNLNNLKDQVKAEVKGHDSENKKDTKANGPEITPS